VGYRQLRTHPSLESPRVSIFREVMPVDST
jgi:hypothetical protein